MPQAAVKNEAKPADPKSILRGKTTVVTGAGRGLGRAIATAFAQAGACSIFVVRDRAVGEKLVADLSAQGYEADTGVADVSDASQVSMLVLDLVQRHPTIDVLVNNAGIFMDEDRATRPSQIDPLVLKKTFDVNLGGPIAVSNAFLSLMPPGSRIINVSSSMGQLSGEPTAYGPAYSMSKAALNMFTQQLAAEQRSRRIMVDCFDPGWVRTEMGGTGATREPEEAARTALFLATRPPTSKTGLFWRDSQVIPW